MHGRLGRLFGKYTEEMFFEGDQSALNPMRYIPTPFHTKLAQQRTALSQYIQQEAIGTPMRRWDRSIHDFLAPYVRCAIARVTGDDVIPQGRAAPPGLGHAERTTSLPSVPLKRPLFSSLPPARPASPTSPVCPAPWPNTQLLISFIHASGPNKSSPTKRDLPRWN
jgi:hypothetical protein